MYVGGPEFGLRASAGSFDAAAMAQAAARCHGLGRKTVCDHEHLRPPGGPRSHGRVPPIPAGGGADGVLVVRSRGAAPHPAGRSRAADLPSTQASTLNADACAFWLEQGVRRIVLARELRYEQIAPHPGADRRG